MEWAAAFQIFVKFHFLRIDTNNGKVENYKFVKNSRKFITFCKIAIFTLYVLYCTFFFQGYFPIYLNLLHWSFMEVNILITVNFSFECHL